MDIAILGIIAPVSVLILLSYVTISDWYRWNKGICRDTNEPWKFVRFTSGDDIVFTCRGNHLRVLWFERLFVRGYQMENSTEYWESSISLQDMQTSINSLSSL